MMNNKRRKVVPGLPPRLNNGAPLPVPQPGKIRATMGLGGATQAQAHPKKMKPTDVVGIMTDITAKDSDLMRQARTDGLQASAARGLLSSSMAVGASQAEAYKAAVPLAQQQAEINASINEARKDRRFEGNQAQKDRRLQKGLQSKELKFNERMKRLDLDAVDRAKVADMLTQSQQTYEQALATIMANENLSAEDRETQVRKLESRYTARNNMIQDLYGVDISFGPTRGGGGGGGGSGGGGGGTGTGFSRLPENPKIGDLATLSDGRRVRWSGSMWQIV